MRRGTREYLEKAYIIVMDWVQEGASGSWCKECVEGIFTDLGRRRADVDVVAAVYSHVRAAISAAREGDSFYQKLHSFYAAEELADVDSRDLRLDFLRSVGL